MSNLHPPPADTSVATVPAAPPPTRHIGPVSISPADIRTRSFGGFLDRDDPLEGAGVHLQGFSFANSYPVAPHKHKAVIQQLFGNVYGHVRGNSLPGSQVQVVDFDDVRTEWSESARRYIIIDRETQRCTHMRVVATFRSYGDYLYVSVDSYLLPPLALGRVLLLGLVLCLLSKTDALLAEFGASETGRLLGEFGIGFSVQLLWAGMLAWVAWEHRDVIHSMRADDSFIMALRRKYHSRKSSGTFNSDDVLMHFKSTTLMIVEAMQEVFEKNDIPLELLDRVRDSINMSTTLNVGDGGILSVAGNVVGGLANRGGSRA